MRVTKKGFCLGVLMIAIAAVAIWVAWPRGPSKVFELQDGSALYLEKVSYGRREEFEPGGWLQRARSQVAARLPKSWAARLQGPRNAGKTSWQASPSTVLTNEIGLHVWITRRNGVLGGYQNVDVQVAEVVDEDGCAFLATQVGGYDSGLLPVAPPAGVGPSNAPARPAGAFGTGPRPTTGPGNKSSVNWFRFQNFPRRDQQITVRFFDAQRILLAEFTVLNPAPVPPLTNAPPLPVAVTNDGVVFRLTSATVRTNLPVRPPGATPLGQMVGYYRDALFEFDILENGVLSSNWDVLSMELTDGSGNIAPSRGARAIALCPREPVWRLKVQFAGRAASTAASNIVWTLSGIAVPEAGTAKAMSTNFQLGSLMVKMIGVGGAGDIIYSSSAPPQASPYSGTSVATISTSFSGGPSSRTESIHAPYAHLALTFSPLREEQRLTILATDDQRRQTYAWSTRPISSPITAPRGRMNTHEIHYLGRNSSGPGAGSPRPGAGSPRPGATFLLLDLAPDARTMDLTFCLHEPRTLEFVFQPSADEAKR